MATPNPRAPRFAFRAAVPATLVLVLLCASASAFICIASVDGPCIHWTNNRATVRTFLGTPSRTLLNGTTSWDENVVLAANDWNAKASAFRFEVGIGGPFINPCGARGPNHACTNTGPTGDNPIFYAADFCGNGFGDIIELTNNCYIPNTGAMVNAPVFVNSNVLWNAYDGRIRFDADVPVYDIRRVVLHELGHVLGLDHPDDHGQSLSAIMNSRVSNLDRLQSDDVAGLFSLYPSGSDPGDQGSPPTSGCAMVPRGDSDGAWLLASAALLVWLSRRRQSIHCRRR